MKWECWAGRVSRWRRWFAWHPIQIDCTVYWLVYVYRKGRVYDTYYDNLVLYEYSLTKPEKES